MSSAAQHVFKGFVPKYAKSFNHVDFLVKVDFGNALVSVKMFLGNVDQFEPKIDVNI